jgi:hypothetical protein
MLTNFEKNSIEQGLLNIHSIGPDATVSFSANKLRNPSVAWINERWFLERQLDLTDQQVRDRLEQWLLSEYAFVIPDDNDSLCEVEPVTKTFYADSYGATYWASHGGSGRVGINGHFQVKGIGKTPLAVEITHDWGHSHGCLSFEEALREAVYSEITANEFPHGAVPILAVIDTGLRYAHANGKVTERRALTVRPVVVRPAYFERALSFRPAEGEHEARTRDVRRVKQMVQYLESSMLGSDQPTLQKTLTNSFNAFARQVAHSRAHRLFQGNYASSNLSLDGALLDFGAARALPNWCSSFSMNHSKGFGNEVQELTDVIRSVVFYVNKYKNSQSAEVNSDKIIAEFTKEIERAFANELLCLVHLENVKDDHIKEAAATAIYEYYTLQQRVEVRFQNGCIQKLGWMGDMLSVGTHPIDRYSAEYAVWAKLVSAVCSSSLDAKAKSVALRRMWTTAARLLPLRLEIVRDTLIKRIGELIAERDRSDCATRFGLEAEISGLIARNRRNWPFVPRNFIVLAQASSPRGSVLYCVDPESDEYFLWIEGVLLSERIWCIDRWLNRSLVDRYEYNQRGNWWFGLFPASAEAPEAILSDLRLSIPDNAVWFDKINYVHLGALFGDAVINWKAEVGTAGSQHKPGVNHA